MALQMLRTSERNSFKRCQWQWWHEYVLELRQANPRPGAADFGTGLHFCLAEWYIPGKKRGVDPRTTWREWMADRHGQYVRIDDLSDPEHDGQTKFEDALELGEEMLTYYLERWGKDRNWTILAPEQRFSVRIPHPTPIFGPSQKKRSVVNLVGTMDGIYRDEDDGKIRILETKSTNRNLERYMIDTVWSEQFGGYDAVATHVCRTQGLIGPKEFVRGMTYNLLRRARQDDRPIGPTGQRHNQPGKENYAQALADVPYCETSWSYYDLMKLPITSKDTNKMTLSRLAEATDIEVLGDVSAKQPTPYFMRETIDRTNKQRNRQIKRIGEEALVMRQVRRGNLPLLKTPTMDCGWQCEFFELCQVDENGDDYEYFRDNAFEHVDPYADHRSNATNSKVSNG